MCVCVCVLERADEQRGQAVGCGVCDTPELSISSVVAPRACVRVVYVCACACAVCVVLWCRALNLYIHVYVYVATGSSL